MKHGILTLLIALAALFAVAGCSTPTTVTEYDSSGAVTKTTVTERDIVDKLTESTRHKLVFAWSNGWSAYVEAVMSEASSGTITPTGKIFAGKVGKGYLSIPEGFSCPNINIADIVAATHENLSVGFTGASAASDTASAETTQTTTSAGTGASSTAATATAATATAGTTE